MINSIGLRRLAGAAAALLLCACTAGGNGRGGSEAPLPPELFSGKPEAGVEPLLAIKKTARVGDEVCFSAVIGGRVEPFTEQRAVMVVSDGGLPLCTDGCTTPWDYCCEVHETITAHSAVVQVVGPDGRPLKTGLRAKGNLQPGKRIELSGIVVQAEAGVFVVNARRIRVVD